jgi:hypothetical protein
MTDISQPLPRKGIDMTTNWKDVARATLEGSESGSMTFPQNLKVLMEAGFDGYAVDFRRSTRTYYMPNGEALELKTEPTPTPVAPDMWSPCSVDECSITAAPARPTLSTSLGHNRELSRERRRRRGGRDSTRSRLQPKRSSWPSQLFVDT